MTHTIAIALRPRCAAIVLRTIRVALLDMKPKLRDILTEAIARETDMELVTAVPGAGSTRAADKPDVLVGEVDDPLDFEVPTELLRSAPGARVLMVAATGETGALFELRPSREVLPNVSIADVIDGIRFGLGPRGAHTNSSHERES